MTKNHLPLLLAFALLTACGGTTASGTGGATTATGGSGSSGALTSGPEVPVPPGMVRVPGGQFVLGSATGESIERPPHQVTLSPYFIDRTEVTVLAYRECHTAGHCSEPNRYDELE